MPIPKSGSCKDHYLPYPFLLGYSSALLKRDSDADVMTFDACALDFDEKQYLRHIQSYSPDVLVMEVPTVSFPLVMTITKKIKEEIDCKIVISGSHVTALTREILEQYPFIDYCLLGEYEVTLRELVTNLMHRGNEKGLRKLRGLAFRQKSNISVNPRREPLKMLDYLPFPDREDLPIEQYHDFEIGGKPCAQITTSRGCPSNCCFCIDRHVIYASPLYRRREPEKIVDECLLVRERYKAKQIYFDDETMVISRKHIETICEQITNRRLELPWTCMGDVTLDYRTLELMAKAGCVGIKFGVETTSAKTLADIKKVFVNPNKVERFVKWCRKLGVWTHATYMIGLLGENKRDILKTADFAVKLDTDSAQFSIATPFPGTPFFEIAKENNWLVTLDWTMYDGATRSVVSYPWLTKEDIEQLFQYAIKRYYKTALFRSLLNPRKIIKLIHAGNLSYAFRKVNNVLMERY